MRSLSVILLSLTACGCSLNTIDHVRTEKKTIDSDGLQSIDLSTYNGSIEVASHDASTVEAEMTFKAWGKSEGDARKNCEALRCKFSETDGTLNIKATKPAGQWSASASFVLRVPKACTLALTTSNGKVSVKNTDANVKLRSSNGAIECRELQGGVIAETSNGTIKVTNCGSGHVQLKTSNGKVSYSGRLTGNQNEITTSNGTIELELPLSQLSEVTARTSNGKISCDLPMTKVHEESKTSLHAVVGRGDGDHAAGSISIRTSNGSVKIGAWTDESPSAEAEPATTQPQAEKPEE